MIKQVSEKIILNNLITNWLIEKSVTSSFKKARELSDNISNKIIKEGKAV